MMKIITAVQALLLTASLAAGEVATDLRNLSGVPRGELAPLVVAPAWPQEVGQGAVCLWRDDKTAVCTLTIDDNLKPDHAWWLEQGRKYGFRFTWFMVVGGVVAGKNPGMNGTWADFQALIDAGHDVQSHTWSHRNKGAGLSPEEDYAKAIPALAENLKGAPPLTLAYPGGGLPNDPKAAAALVAGARGTIGTSNGPRPDWLDVHSTSGGPSFDAPIGSKTDFASLLPLLEPKAKNYRGWFCVHFHGVGLNAEMREKTLPRTVALLDFLKAREADIWVAGFRDVVLYGQSRDTATLRTVASTPAEIRLGLTDRMHDPWYDQPLTVRVRLADAWTAIAAEQAGKPLRASVVERDGHRYAMVDIVPDRGEAVIRPK